jgi:5-methyltetrahydrofolate--homocysteine methyltransferase
MSIVNAGQLAIYDDLPAELREAVEDDVLDRRPDATERLLDIAPNMKEKYVAGVRAEYVQIREGGASGDEARDLVPLTKAQANRMPIDWEHDQPPVPAEPGVQTLRDIPLEEIAAYIDWTFFFHAWELRGRFPQILDDPEKGVEARERFDDAKAMLHNIIAEKWLGAAAVIGLFPANTVGDDIAVYADESRSETLLTFHCLRKQGKQPPGKYNECLADYIAPAETGIPDYVGGFACTTGIGIDERVAAFEADHDDYSAIMLKAIADRLA